MDVQLLFLIPLAFVMEIIDSSLGMMYGTLLAPILVGYGLEPLAVVPGILISQAIGGVAGTISHHKFGNANFFGLTRDVKVVLAMVLPGLLVIMLGVFGAVNLPKFWVKIYLGILVIVMSILCLFPLKYSFAWWKHYLVGMLAAFNKALSGGGFGPVTSTGGIIGGLSAKASIATTTFAEVWVCLAAFIAYLFFTRVDFPFAFCLSLGSLLGGFVGPYISSRINHKKLRICIGVLGILSGIWLFWRLLG